MTPATHPWSVLIVDDEPLARGALRAALVGAADFVVVGEASDGLEAVEKIQGLDPDLVFLDIRMPGLDGFDVVREVGPGQMPEVVFVTAFDEYALEAFEVHALDYLVKPWDDDRFGVMLDHARSRLEGARDGGAELGLTRLLQALAAPRGPGAEGLWAQRLMVREGERVRFVEVESIDYIQSDGNHVIFHRGRTSHRTRGTLRALEERLDPSRFVRIHRSTILNLDGLAEVIPWRSGDHEAVLKDGRRLRVSRHYRSRLLKESF